MCENPLSSHRQDSAIKKQTAAQANRKAATRKFGTRLATRTKRAAAKSIAAIPAESIPFIGVAVIVADTGYELYAACETVKDLDQSTRRYQKIFWSFFGERTNTKIGGRQ
jgi:hypothetical protein